LQGISEMFKEEVSVTSNRSLQKCEEFSSICTKLQTGYKQRSGLHTTNICVTVSLTRRQGA